MKTKTKLSLVVIPLFSILFLGWGSVGHRIINQRTILSVTPQMTFWESWSDSLAAHGSDADYRKSTDPTEAPKHYIDIDNYPEFVSTGRISQNFDSLVALHGYSFVMDQGTLPWAVLQTTATLQNYFQNNDFSNAMLTAADLGHYIGDMHMPLHLTRNYNGQYTGQSGVHSRYESDMINRYSNQISYAGDSVFYITDISEFVFETVYENYLYVDSVLRCDSIAKAFAGNTNSTTYYLKLWELSKEFTTKLFKNASFKLTCLIYTAWINAGSPVFVEDESIVVTDFRLSQNYPNPFNPSTTIQYAIPNVETRHASSLHVMLQVYDILGNEITTLVNEEKPAGTYVINFNAANLNSGVYFYRLQAGSPSSGSGQGFIETRKMILLK
ncbi:MAG: T9SS type A sorting domain-containing protein [Ignavibacteriales bacterium]|nr:MAG: T9SS type A sorting domain-containing protein [Ignavibacteriales bacterium]